MKGVKVAYRNRIRPIEVSTQRLNTSIGNTLKGTEKKSYGTNILF